MLLCVIQVIDGQDLFACEGQFQPSCHAAHISREDPDHWTSQSSENKDNQKALENAHQIALSYTVDFIKQTVIEDKQIVQEQDLTKIYKEKLKDTPYGNMKYLSQKC